MGWLQQQEQTTLLSKTLLCSNQLKLLCGFQIFSCFIFKLHYSATSSVSVEIWKLIKKLKCINSDITISSINKIRYEITVDIFCLTMYGEYIDSLNAWKLSSLFTKATKTESVLNSLRNGTNMLCTYLEILYEN